MASRGIGRNEFFETISRRSGVAESRVRKAYEEMLNLIAEELRFNGVIYCPDFCRIKATFIEGRMIHLFDYDEMFQESHYHVSMKANDVLKSMINLKLMGDMARAQRNNPSKKSRAVTALEDLSYEEKERERERVITQIMDGTVNEDTVEKKATEKAPNRKRVNRKRFKKPKELDEVMEGL